MQIINEKQMQEYTFLTLRQGPSGPWYVTKLHKDHDQCTASRFDDKHGAEEWLDYQLGWLRYWSQLGPPANGDSEASIKGYRDAREDHAAKVAWDKEKAQAWSDEYEEQRNGWMS